MKRLLILLATIGLIGCATVPKQVLTPQERCATISTQVAAETETTVVTSLMEEDKYFYHIGWIIAMEMQKDDHTPVPVNVYLQHRGITVMGYMGWVVEKEGLYLLEDSCDYRAGELEAWRLDQKVKVTNE